jgi:hypothetical protein
MHEASVLAGKARAFNVRITQDSEFLNEMRFILGERAIHDQIVGVEGKVRKFAGKVDTLHIEKEIIKDYEIPSLAIRNTIVYPKCKHPEEFQQFTEDLIAGTTSLICTRCWMDIGNEPDKSVSDERNKMTIAKAGEEIKPKCFHEWITQNPRGSQVLVELCRHCGVRRND